MNRYSFLIALAVLITIFGLAACEHNDAQARLRSGSKGDQAVANTKSAKLFVELSSGQAEAEKIAANPQAKTTPLPSADTQTLLKRLPQLPGESGLQKDFAKRAETMPAPRTGNTVSQPFPAPADLQAPAPPQDANIDPGKLQVLRFAPEGDVPVAPQVSITFSQPMVELNSQAGAAATVPVKLNPQPKGSWRWLGTKTLIFEAEGTRLPQATTYKVTIPQGTKSANGKTLDKEVAFSFTTPSLELVNIYPNAADVELSPVVLLRFNQAVEAAKVLPYVEFQNEDKDIAFHQVAAADLKENRTYQSWASRIPANRLLAIAPDKELEKDTSYYAGIKRGAPSAEGPNPARSGQNRSFKTYGPFELKSTSCGWQEKDAPPGTPWHLRFTNCIDDAHFDPATQLTVTPELEGMRVSVSGSEMTICGNSKGRTKYKVTIAPSLRDEFNQNLVREESATFTMGSSRPALQTVGGNLVVLDPNGPRSYSLYTINQPELKISINKVAPSDYPQFLAWRKEQFDWRVRNGRTPAKQAMPGKTVFSQTVKTTDIKDAFVESKIDLSSALNKEGLGHCFVVIKADGLKGNDLVITWIQATKIGLSAYADSTAMQAWATELATGKPLSDATINGNPCDKQGLVVLKEHIAPNNMLIAKRGEDTAFLYSIDAVYPRTPDKRFCWHTFSDRGIYKPKEKASFKGWLREISAGPQGDVESALASTSSVEWTASDARNNEFAKGTSPLTPYGGFEINLDIPDNVNLGKASLKVSLVAKDGKVISGRFGRNSNSTTLKFDIQEFRTPEFEVQAKNEQSVCLLGEKARVSATAQYYAGGKLPNAKVRWNVTTAETTYSPAGWDEFIFGAWRPWWGLVANSDSDDGEGSSSQADENTLTSTTDASGKHTLDLFLSSSNEPDRAPLAPISVHAAAAISDLNEQTWSSSTDLLVHPSQRYVGLKPLRQFVEKGAPINLDYIVTDLDGKAQSQAQVKVRAANISLEYRQGHLREIEEDVQEQTLVSADKPQRLTLTPKQGGQYRIWAEVQDDQGRRNRTQLLIWVAGAPTVKSRGISEGKVELVPDKKEYKIGDTAEVLVCAPFSTGEGIYTLNREGRVESQRFTLSNGSYTIKVPIKDAYVPNLHLQVNLVGNQERTNDDGTTNKDLAPRPAYAAGHINLSIPPYERTLKIEVKPRERKLSPGANTMLDVIVKDANGQPVADSEVAMIAVDEAVLALMGHKIPNPIASFYSSRINEFGSRDLRSLVQLADPSALAPCEDERVESMVCDESCAVPVCGMMDGVSNSAPRMLTKSMSAVPGRAKAAAPAKAAGASKTAGPAIALRTDFNPQALWMASVRTDSHGVAHTAYKLPDNLTRYRITAVVADKNRKFGYGESSMTACLPLMVRPSLPRFLNFGDRAELPVMVQNQTDKPLTVNVAARAANLTIADPAGKTFTIPANDRREVRFAATTKEAGEAKVQLVASSGDFNDAAEVTLPVWTPCTSEAFATYGQIDKGAISQPVSYPAEVWPQFGSLDITTSSTAVQELTDAFIYLENYPYACSEQIASRMLSALALKDVLTAFKAEGMPSPAKLKATMDADIEQLIKRQESNGGFRTWDDTARVYPYVSMHAARALIFAQQCGYKTSGLDAAVDSALDYVGNIERYINTKEYDEAARRFLRAYAVDVLRSARQPNLDKAKKLVKEAGLNKLDLDTIGFLYPTLSEGAAKDSEAQATVEEIRRLLNNRVSETAGAACFTNSYHDDAHLLLASDRRTDGILLRAMIIDQPKCDLIPKLVRGLLSHRKRGAWGNTQENAFILLALNDYFNTYEKVTPDFVANIWLGEDYAGKHSFKGRSADYQETAVPMQYLAQHPKTNLIMAKEGAGRLYYRLGLKYAPKSLTLDPLDCGFEVTRSYEGADNPADVKRLPDGSWQIKLGSRVHCRTTMVAPSRRYHVALINPLPAGFETLNPDLKVTEDLPASSRPTTESAGKGLYANFWQWWAPWYEHSNLRDERAEAFTTGLPCGSFDYDFYCRATTPGTFIVPPAKAEEMYSPEVFGRSSSDKVIVK